ncbi:MAG: carboxypeptidase regulatory-like domain-containing protein [Acidobacteria bacterium]|nr:carboxypeptidase regulatory-like domain-containing protein [Acidobacteriota bacterium]
MKRSRARVTAWALFAALTLGAIPSVATISAAYAQNVGQRSVGGLVVDGESAPVQGATVFLKNSKTKAIRSYTSASNGRFRFAQVNMTDDYDLWAEKDGKKSPTKTVSSWNASKEYETELKLK